MKLILQNTNNKRFHKTPLYKFTAVRSWEYLPSETLKANLRNKVRQTDFDEAVDCSFRGG